MKRIDIANPFNAPVFHEESVTSTMAFSRSLAVQGERHGTVIAADFQESGRGRTTERPWLMERGASLPFTILLRYSRIEAIPPALTLRTGLVIVLAIEDFIPSLEGIVMVKWPNDIMIHGKKAAGILIEADGGIVYIGIGINAGQNEFPVSLQDKATSLSLAAGRPIPADERFALLEKILARLHAELETADGTAADWRQRLEQRLYKKGEQVSFIAGEAGSGRIVEGRLTGIGPGGELLIIPQGKCKARAFITGELKVY